MYPFNECLRTKSDRPSKLDLVVASICLLKLSPQLGIVIVVKRIAVR
jgi:hypothetical protein